MFNYFNQDKKRKNVSENANLNKYFNPSCF